MYILVLESSTTSAKAMLYDTEKGTYEVRTKAYTLCYDDITLHDAENVFKETVDLGKELCIGKKIDIISLGGTWHSLVLCNTDMEPQTPVYLWSYTGAADLCKELRKDKRYMKEFYQKTGCMVNGIYPAFKLKLLKEKGYCLDNYLIAGQGTYNMFRLTGERVIMDSMASGTGLLNIHTKQFDADILADLGIKESQISRLVTYKDTFPLSKEGAQMLGIEEGIPVIPTGPDGGLNQVGAGALGDDVMTFSVGTSGAIRLTTQKPIIPEEPSTWCYLSPKAWLSGAATSGCCNCIDWFKNKMFSPNTTYDDIEKGFGNIENTPVFLPFLFGERCPGWQDDRNAAFFDIKPFHTANDLYHAVMEGVLFNLYQCYEVLSNINGIPKKIKLSGGILHSSYWTQMCADIFGTDMEVDNVEHSSLLGGVALGMELLGEIQDVKDFITESTKVIHSNLEMADIYAKKYVRYKYWYDKTI
ncbi:gluconokinase [Anaerovirgula multivorans]|uniref:Gluconokinase n=1 Tax=Anaerovirgula multivorans TaxID=312168 RepID=A0A239CD64_9FIRM|nr:FGGY family carbohydrate kinase [Anaerovirgula multivorans]SNS17581.1 gluconokinase [Anaerovirgula multivorans]